MIQSFLITVFWHDLLQGNILLSTPTTLMLIFYPLSLFEFRLGLNWAGSKKAVYKLRCNNRSSSTWKLFAIRKSIPNLFQCKRTALDARRITQVNFCWLYAADLSEPLTPFRSPSNVLLPTPTLWPVIDTILIHFSIANFPLGQRYAEEQITIVKLCLSWPTT